MANHLLDGEEVTEDFIVIDVPSTARADKSLTNSISTTRYSCVNFVPKSLFEQFLKTANIWFLVVSVLQLLPLNLSATTEWSTVMPFSFILVFSMISAGYADYKRHKSDCKLNNHEVAVWSVERNRFLDQKWVNLQVGNIVSLKEGPVPADIFLLTTSDSKRHCFVETTGLDGHYYLKTKVCLDKVSNNIEGPNPQTVMDHFRQFERAKLHVEKPNNSLNSFHGKINLGVAADNWSIDITNVLLRGSHIRNTEWVIGVVVNTGNNTKLMQNIRTPKSKQSDLAKRVERYLIPLLLLIGSLVTVCFTIMKTEKDRLESEGEYRSWWESLLTLVILYNGIIPISLYVSIDIVRLIQGQFIQIDLRMYDSKLDRVPQVKNCDLNENMGQIEYIFTDKTGTLTDNELVFKKCFVGQTLYGRSEFEPTNRPTLLRGYDDFQFSDPDLYEEIKNRRNPEVRGFFECMSLCHTVEAKEKENGHIKYQAVSADEEALLIAAHCMGFSFRSNRNGTYYVDIDNEHHAYRVLGVNHFTPERRRMSIVLQPEDFYCSPVLYCKGEESAMLNCCQLDDASIISDITQELQYEGLRTLIFAKRELTQEQAEEFERRHKSLLSSFYQRTEGLERLANEFEKDLEFLGVSAVEDRIQQDIPETVTALLDEGIKIWMLTGDNVENSVNIAYSSRLFNPTIKLYKLLASSEHETHQKLTYFLSNHTKGSKKKDHSWLDNFEPVRLQQSAMSNANREEYRFINNRFSLEEELKVSNLESINIGLTVDGVTLEHILYNKSLLKMFLILASLCRSVICYRLSPFQKAEVLRAVRRHYSFSPITLAIGDGANDISMIQEADVGVGIMGREGMQAANSSDVALARFTHLKTLLLLHGRWNYTRVAKVVLYSFYKNLLVTLPIFYFSCFAHGTATILFPPSLMMFFNVLFTSVPIIVLGTIDQDYTEKEVQQLPNLYHACILKRSFSQRVFIKWFAYALLHSLLLYYLFFLHYPEVISSKGYTSSFEILGTIFFVLICNIANGLILLLAKHWTLLFIISVCTSFCLVYLYISVAGWFPTSPLAGMMLMIFTEGSASSHFLIPLVCLFPNLAELFITELIFSRRQSQRVGPYHRYVDNEIESHSRTKYLFRVREFKKAINRIFTLRNFSAKHFTTHINEKYAMSRVTLEFYDSSVEAKYRTKRNKRMYKFVLRMIWALFGFLSLYQLVDIVLNSDHQGPIVVLMKLMAVFALLTVCILYTWVKTFRNKYHVWVLIIVFCGLSYKFVNESIVNNDASMSTAITPLATFILFNVSTYRMFFVNLFFLIGYLLRILLKYSTELGWEDSVVILLHYWVLLPGIFLTSAYVGRRLEKEQREEFKLEKKTKQQYVKSQNILGYLLPDFVKEDVATGYRYHQSEPSVTILFCDIYDFDSICADYQPDELTSLLDTFFTLLDKLCYKHGLAKIETVNKTFMACGGLQAKEKDLPAHHQQIKHAERCIDMALKIRRKVDNVVLKTGEPLKVKIGIHSGSVIAGVVGGHKPQFSLVGDAVNTASRMCSTLEGSGQIQISEYTYSLINPHKYSCLQSQVEAKGKGSVTTYLVEGYTRAGWSETLYYKGSNSNHLHNSRNASLEQTVIHEDRTSDFPPPEPVHAFSVSSKVDISKINFITDEKTHSSMAGPVQVLECRQTELPQNYHYRVDKLEKSQSSILRGLNLCVGIYGILTVINGVTLAWDSSGTAKIYLTARVFCFFLLLMLRLFYSKTYKRVCFSWVVMLLYSVVLVVGALSIRMKSSQTMYISVLEMMFLNLVVNHISGLTFGFIMYLSVFSAYFWFCCVYDMGLSALEISIFLYVFNFINCYTSYKLEQGGRGTYNLALKANASINKTEQLLSQMLPKHVLNNMNKGINETDRHKNVTVLYADIVGFTRWSSTRTPNEVITMLSKLFREFDHLCVRYKVYKVHTIGDCYVVLSFTDKELRNPATECLRVVKMGLEMIPTIENVNKKKGTNFRMRIGIHTGTIVAGITGTNIVRYDIYGPDNDIANKMESKGYPGKVTVSKSTRNILIEHYPDMFRFHFNRVITHKPTDREIDSYFIEPATED